MTYKIDSAGWVRGEIPGPDMPYEVEVIPSDNNPHTRLAKNPPDLCLHTTEGSHVNPAMEFEPQWIVGEFRVVQLHPVWAKGYSVDELDNYIMQVECVAKSTLTRGVFPPATQNPLVALVAMLHKEHLITSGTGRPGSLAQLPIILDRLPAATDRYYRRFLAAEPTFDGVRGHVDLKGDEHWDPGSYDYPVLFKQVESLIGRDEEDEDEMAFKDYEEGMDYRRDFPDRPMPKGKSASFNRGWTTAKLRDVGNAAVAAAIKVHAADGAAHAHAHQAGVKTGGPVP